MTPTTNLPVLTGELCQLRSLTLADAPSLQRHADDPAVATNLFEGFPSPYTLAEAQRWCGGMCREPAFGNVWGIAVASEVIGCVSVRPDTGWMRCNAEVGYWIGQAHWRRGIASEALGLVSDWAWANLPEVTRLYAPIFARNAGSQAVARRCGYQLEGVLRQSLIKNGQVIDRALWARYRNA
ncbi:MAG: GNAT family N-acetyltransferase [Burkholderiales bacterium]|nr:GNAT family N-acetyltransferase [Burkholderiales bacterium]